MIGKHIAALRVQKGVTQEQLATALGVSAPAVSKWESGRSCPDIQLLRPLARFFGVTIDSLMDFEGDLTGAQADDLICRLKQCFKDEGFAAGLAYAAKLNQAYPDNKPLQYRLAGALQMCAIYAPDDEAVKASHHFQEKLLRSAAETKDAALLNQSRFLLAINLMAGDDLTESRELLESLSELGTEASQAAKLIPTLLLREGYFDKAEKAAQQLLLCCVSDAIHSLITLTGTAAKQGNIKKAHLYASAQESLIEKNGLMPLCGATFSQTLLIYAKAAGDNEALLRSVRLFSDWLLAEKDAIQIESDLFDLVELKRGVDAAQRGAMLRVYVKELKEDEAYAPLYENAEFERIMAALMAQ